MRSMFVIAASAALLSLAAPAARANEMSFGLKAGASIPMGDYGDFVGPGFMGGVYGDMGVSPSFALGLDVVGNFHGISSDLKDEFEALGATDPKFDVTLIQFGLHGKWQQSATTGPEVQVGIAMYNVHAKVEVTDPGTGLTISDDDSDTKFGFNVGAGYKFWHSESMSLGIEASFHNVMDAIPDPNTGDDTSAQYISVGLNLGFLTHGSTAR